MSRKIIGVTVGTTLPKPNFKQTDPTKGDYIRNKPDFDGLKDQVDSISELVGDAASKSYLDTHIDNKSNPHSITKAQVGLENVDNVKQYSVENPPIVAQATAPTDTSVVWIDTEDNTADGLQEIVNEAMKSSGALMYTEQALTEEQKAQARENIGVGKESTLSDFIANTDIAHLYDETTGAYYTVIRVYKQKIDGTKQFPFVYAHVNNGVYGTTAYDLAYNEGFLLTINAGVFNSSNKPDGVLIQGGKVLNNGASTLHNECKPMTIDRNGNLGYAAYDADASELVSSGIISAVCGFMPIVVDYEAVPQSEWNSVSHYTENAQRQIIGQWGNGDYAIITCEGRGFHNSDGWTIAEAQTICQKHGLKFAYNLDGGGSTETMLGLKPINTIYENTTGRIVPTFIVFNGTTVPPKSELSNAPYELVMYHSMTQYNDIGYGTIDTRSENRITAVSAVNAPKLPLVYNKALTGEISDYAPIALPDGAVSITVVCPGFLPGIALWITDGDKWTRTFDPGLMSNGGGTYTLPTDGEYTHYTVNFRRPDNADIPVDTNLSGISIVVKCSTDDDEPDFSELGNLYRLPAETVFSGDDYIDTGVKIVEKDSDFTIAFSVTPGVQTSTAAQIFNCQIEASGYPGICFSIRNNSSDPYYRLAYPSGSNNTNAPKNTTDPFKVVITHKKDTKLFVMKTLYNGIVANGSGNDLAVSNFICDYNLIIGAWRDTSGNKGRYWIGTMHDFYIDDYVWDDSIINAYLK